MGPNFWEDSHQIDYWPKKLSKFLKSRIRILMKQSLAEELGPKMWKEKIPTKSSSATSGCKVQIVRYTGQHIAWEQALSGDVVKFV